MKIFPLLTIIFTIRIRHSAHLLLKEASLAEDDIKDRNDLNEKLKGKKFLKLGDDYLDVRFIDDDAYMDENCFQGLLFKERDIKNLFKKYEVRNNY